ncbi:MAG: hypothetical protein WDN47_04360 [Candidatus Doudnabacteria bacterium]
MRFIRETPWYIFFPLVLAAVGCIIALFRLLRINSQSNQAISNQGRNDARGLAQGRYHLKEKKVLLFRGIRLELATTGRNREKKIIRFPMKHPDYEEFKNLANLEIVEFNYVGLALFETKESEVSPYLRLKRR